MEIDIEDEITDVCNQLRIAQGYSECEKIIVTNIRKFPLSKFDFLMVEHYLDKLYESLEDVRKNTNDAERKNNFSHAANIVKAFLSSPHKIVTGVRKFW